MTSKKDENMKRAMGYALTLVQFQEIGAGPDKNLTIVRAIARELVNLCKDETGIELDTYPTQFLRDNKELTLKNIPYTVRNMSGIE